MHVNSINIMRMFTEKYVPDIEQKVLDLGSRIVDEQTDVGSYRQLFVNKKWHYIGADIERGENVDVFMKDGYRFPFKDDEFDVVISGQTIEHIEFPWLWFVEMRRVLKTGGLCCIIAPALCFEHKYPIDTFRYFPDGMRALAKWSGLTILETKTVDDTTEEEIDCYMVAKKV